MFNNSTNKEKDFVKDTYLKMPFWYFEKKDLKNTPSMKDGIDAETEYRYRREGSRFIIDTGTKMDLGYNTMATGVVYFHRFFMVHSFRDFSRYVTACTCLLLAGKVEETPKKCKDIIRTARNLLTEQKILQFGSDPKEEVITLERILLQTIKFELQVEHPYSFLLTYAKCLKGDKNKLQKIVQMAWTFVNDSLCTTLCLQWEPEIIAVALIYLAGKLSKFEVVDWTGRKHQHKYWWEMFIDDMSLDLLEDVCHQVLDLYSKTQNAPPESPPLPPRPKTPDMKLQPLAPPPEPPKFPSESMSTPIESMTPTVRPEMYHYHYSNVQYPPAFATSLGPMPGHSGVQGMNSGHLPPGYTYQGINYSNVPQTFYNQNPGTSYYAANI